MMPSEEFKPRRSRRGPKGLVLAALFILTSTGFPLAAQASETPLFLSPSVAVALEKFQANGLPGFFAVSEGGNAYGFAHCRTDADCGERAEALAARFCQEDSNQTCHTLTDKHDTLWPGPVTMPASEDVELVKAGWRSFPTFLSWPSSAAATHAWSLVPEGKAIGWIKVSRPSPLGSCYGAYASASDLEGSWHLICGPEESASGTYRRQSDRWISEGRSRSGESVRFVTHFK